MNYVQFVCQVVKIRLHEQVLGLMRNVKCRTSKMEKKRRPKLRIYRFGNLRLV